MQPLKPHLKTHVLICCHSKEGKACCAAKGSSNWAETLKTWTQEQGLKGRVRVSRSSCLGHCDTGVTAVFYPQNEWYHHLKFEDMDLLKEKIREIEAKRIIKGIIVNRDAILTQRLKCPYFLIC